jgi:uncharacterized protein HemY
MRESPFIAVQSHLNRAAYDQAAEEMKSLDQALQESAEGLTLWSFIYLKGNDWQHLEETGRELRQKAPQDPRGIYCVAESLFRRDRAKEAIEIFREAEPLFQDRVKFLYTLSRMHVGAKEFEKALQIMEEAYALSPGIKDTALFDQDFEPIWLGLIDQQ